MSDTDIWKDREYIEEFIWSRKGEFDEEGWTLIDDVDGEKHRWYQKHLLILEGGGVLWGTYYNQPLTELQEGMGRFEDYEVGGQVPLFRVRAVPMTTVTYVPV